MERELNLFWNFLKNIESSDKLKMSFKRFLFWLGSLFITSALFLNYSTEYLKTKFLPEDAFVFDEKNIEFGFIVFSLLFLSPFLEELIFRYPLKFFKSHSKRKIAFYFSTFVFAFIHISSYKVGGISNWYFIPVLLLPQILGGVVLGYFRLQYGMIWCFLLHGYYNFLCLIWGYFFDWNL